MTQPDLEQGRLVESCATCQSVENNYKNVLRKSCFLLANTIFLQEKTKQAKFSGPGQISFIQEIFSAKKFYSIF
jgi:hypothetical protein